MEFVVANTEKSIQIMSDKGSIIKPFQVLGNIRQLEATSQVKKPTLGVLTSAMYYTIDLEKRKTLTKISVDSTYNLINTGIELIPVSVKNSRLMMIKNGKSTQFTIKNNVKLLGSYVLNKEVVFVLTREKELYAYQQNGKILWEKTLPAQEITSMSIQNSKQGIPILCVLDGLENELYILDQNGRENDQNDKHGETKVQVSSFGANAYSITTFLGSYIIQYTKQ
jgi:outer membrane protein assembly factor BamB